MATGESWEVKESSLYACIFFIFSIVHIFPFVRKTKQVEHNSVFTVRGQHYNSALTDTGMGMGISVLSFVITFR